MMCAAVAPFGRLLSAPNAVISVVGLLRTIVQNTETMAKATSVLPEIHRDMRQVAEAVAVLDPMDARMAAIEGAMPVLVEVQKSLVRLPGTAEHLDSELTRLAKLLDELHASLEPLSRLAQRFPGGGNRP